MERNPSPRSLDEEDESVRIAVKALGDMRNRAIVPPTPAYPTPAPASAAGSSSPKSAHSPSSSLNSIENAYADSPPIELYTRVSQLPFVGSVMTAYEQSKASSRVVKYGAEMVESSVKTISRPVIDRLPVNVNTLDEFACRQLDRLGKYGGRSLSRDTERMQTDEREQEAEPLRGGPNTVSGVLARDRDVDMRRGEVPPWLEATSPFVPPPPSPPDSRSPTPQCADDPTREQARGSAETSSEQRQQQQQVVVRSRWQAVLLEAGGLSAAVSEESMRRLKYCLHWLQYATSHIDAQILILRDFMLTLQQQSHASSLSSPLSPQHMRTLKDVRHDLVHTIRQVVDVVSKYAGGALPEPARARVRGFILTLPQRWASAAGNAGLAPARSAEGPERRGRGRYPRLRGGGSESSTSQSSPASSRATSPLANRVQQGKPASAGAAMHAAQRVLTLATESLDMMRGVTGVVKDSLDRADAWVGRMRMVGIQRERSEEAGTGAEEPAEKRIGSPRLSLNESGESSTASTATTPYEFSVPGTPVDAPSPGVSGGLGAMSLDMLVIGGKGGERVDEVRVEGNGKGHMDVDG